jgi:hypothetical protein
MNNLKLVILICLFIKITPLYSQQVKITGYITDGSNGLNYVMVENIGKNKGVITDSTGFFSIEATKYDTLIISHLGYVSQRLTNLEEKKYLIQLQQKIIQLSEIIITPSKKINLNLGTNDKSPTEGGFNLAPGMILAYQVIPDIKENKNSKLTYFEVFIRDEGILETPFRVRVFSKIGDISEDLLTESIIVVPKKKNKWVKVDLSKFNILIPENGILLGVEYIENNQKYFFENNTNVNGKTKKYISYGHKIAGTFEFTENNTWLKYLGGRWYQQKFLLKGKPLNLALRVMIETEQ